MKAPAADFLETADFIGAKLSRDAIWSGRQCNWYGVPVHMTQRSVALEAQSVCGSDFYSGTSGIAVFLARLFAATGERIFRLTAEGAIRQTLSHVDHFSLGARVDFYHGLTGVAYSLFEIAQTCGIDKFNDMGLLILEEISSDDVAIGSSPYVWSGAGTVDVLLRMYQRHQRDFVLSLAIRYGEELLKQLAGGPHKWSEANALSEVDDAFLEAVSIAWSMLGLFELTREKKYREAAEHVLFIERSGYNASADQNTQNSGDACKVHEANRRIARANLRAFEILQDNVYSSHASQVIQIIQAQTDSRDDADVNLSLGHGLTADADLLIESSTVLGNEQLRRSAERVGSRCIERYRLDDLPWPCGSSTGWDAPSFMIGLAGIGYFYLRLHDPLVPSVFVF